MSGPEPSHVEIDSTRYAIIKGSYEEWVESDVLRDTRISGASRPAFEPRPDVRTWRIDDWSAGEGHKFWDTSQDNHPSQRGFLTIAGGQSVDVRVPGQVKLGLDGQTQSIDLGGSIGYGPFLAIVGGNLWAAYDAVTKEQTGVDTWTARTSGMNAQHIEGPVSGTMSGLFIAGVRSGADGGVRRVTSAGNTSWVAETSRSPLVADNRVYYLVRGTTTSTLKYSGLDAAVAGTVATTFAGIGSTYAGDPIQSVAIGSRIYTLIFNDGESARLWVLENGAGREICVFEGLLLKVPGSRKQPMCVVNGVVFVAGYEINEANVKVGRVDYFDGDKPGTVFTTQYLYDAGTMTSDFYFTGCFPGQADELIVLNNFSGGLAPGFYSYSMRTGGFARLIGDGSSGHGSGAYIDGTYYWGHNPYPTIANTLIFRSLSSGSGKYVPQATITEPIWDGDMPDTEKILREIEVQTETLASGTSVEVQVVLDGTTSVTTDANGAAMAHSSGTRTIFTVSGTSTERAFRFLTPKILLKTSNTANTPILYSVTYRFTPVATKLRFFEFELDCMNETATHRRTGRQLTGSKIKATLEALRDSTSNRIFTFTPYIKGSDAPWPGPTETQHNAMFVGGIPNGKFSVNEKGQGVFRMRLQKT